MGHKTMRHSTKIYVLTNHIIRYTDFFLKCVPLYFFITWDGNCLLPFPFECNNYCSSTYIYFYCSFSFWDMYPHEGEKNVIFEHATW